MARPSDDHRRALEVMRSAAPTTRGARLMASRGKASAPLRMMNSSMPVSTAAIGAPTRAIAVKARGFGVVAPNAAISATKDSETLAAGHPAQNVKRRGDCEPCGGADTTFGRRSIGSMQGRPPDPHWPSRRPQGYQILANFVIPPQQLPRCPCRSLALRITFSSRSLQLCDQRDHSAAGGSAPDGAAARLQSDACDLRPERDNFL